MITEKPIDNITEVMMKDALRDGLAGVKINWSDRELEMIKKIKIERGERRNAS